MLSTPANGISSHFFCLIIIPLTLLITSCDQSEQQNKNSTSAPQDASTIRLGTTKSSPTWLVHIAESKGYFKQQGLNVEFSNFKSGKRALKGMFNNQVDIATTAEGPVVFFSLIRQDFSIISTIGISSNDNFILARKDVGIESAADLKGKAIATQVASSAHYYLHLFLKENKMIGIDIIQSYMDIESLPNAIVSGLADAIASRDPYISDAKKRLGDNAIIFETPGLYLKSFLLVGSRDYLEDNPEKIQKFVAALLQAEQFIKNNKTETIQLLTTKFNLTNQQIGKILKHLDLSLSLDKLLLAKLEDEANWVLNSKLTESWDVPDFVDYIDTSALQKLKPERITFKNQSE